ncbi:MAG: hypothetical protein RJA70_1569 [Pseudomonadota bacterium]|jgi:putative transcriptional regulator
MSPLAPGLLIAAPPLGDPNFERSVVLVAAHNSEGAFGWVINGEELMTMAELLERTEMPNALGARPRGMVRRGGPVGVEQVWLLYRTEDRPEGVEDQVDVGCGITASSSRKLLTLLREGRAPFPILGVAGYAGWGPDQLEDEIGSGSWLPTDADASLLFEMDPAELWLKAYERAGVTAMSFTTRVVGLA